MKRKIEEYPGLIRLTAERFYVEDDAVFEQNQAVKKIENEVLGLVVAMRTANDTPQHSSDVQRKAACKAALAEREDYAAAKERLRVLSNARNATAAELEELRGQFEVKKIAAWREVNAQKGGQA
jgi:hypothetical protein